jgi:hypothetical protein
MYEDLRFISRFVFMIILLIILVYIVLFKIDLPLKYNTYIEIKNNQGYLYIKKDLLDYIYNKRIMFNDKIINYKIVEISDDLINDKYVYKQLLLTLDIDNKYLIDNNILSVEFVISDDKIIDNLINIIKKGIGL